tara:strand:- start:844 stop:1770 length:927 start_codon:yes stop_codon:yes gene_type:complete
MKFLKPKFWEQKKSFLAFFLLPISFVYQILFFIKKRFTKVNSFEIPIICVGNIYVGGTGKTPLSILLAKELVLHKRYPAIIKKYYKDQIDEQGLIKDNFNAFFFHKSRIAAIQSAIEKNHNFIILDDGFQDFSIKKDLNILCFNSEQLAGNEMTLPSGPLREKLESINRAKIILINGRKNVDFENKIRAISNNLKIYYSNYNPINIEEFKNKKILAFAGIGNPINFFKLLKKHNINLQKKIEFPDHYEFDKFEIQKIVDISQEQDLQIVTTEKDFFRIKKYNFKNIKYLKLVLEIDNKEDLINQLLKL